MVKATLMNFAPSGVQSVKPDGNPKKQVMSETSSNLKCDARVAGTSRGISLRKQTSLHAPTIETT